MVEQLRRKKVDAAFYSIGGAPTAQAWKEWDDRYPPPWDTAPSLIGDYCRGERCVVDFGPGSGQPTLAAIRSFLDHIHEIVLVDVSQAILAIAQDYLYKNTQATSLALSPTSCRMQPRSIRLSRSFHHQDSSSV